MPLTDTPSEPLRRGHGPGFYHLSNQREFSASASSPHLLADTEEKRGTTSGNSVSSAMTRTLLDSVVKVFGEQCVCVCFYIAPLIVTWQACTCKMQRT